MATLAPGARAEDRVSPANADFVRHMHATAADLRGEMRRIAELLTDLGAAIDGEGGLAPSMAREFAETRSLMRLLCPAAERRQPDPFADRCGPPQPGDEGLVAREGSRRLSRPPAAAPGTGPPGPSAA